MRHFIIGLTALVLSIAGLAKAVEAQTYGIQPGDTLRIEVLEDPSLNRNALVLPDGTVNFPLVGTVRVAGRSVAAVRGSITSALETNFAAPPNVFVTVANLAQAGQGGAAAIETMGIYAMGEVARPGLVQAAPGITLLQALAQVGGFTKFAATKRVQLRRVENGAERVFVFDYARGRGISGATALKAGDVIVVPERGLFE
ncbi:polysaccharide biosynthesis/export family protein [Frigidibacter sp. MR17.14]|uniref:polysaccharide biosynthesis/export family protein n=1 Tax=Frigidibacter sp. MR17.14 TaxID=3126509 RepID=UPI003012CE82